MLLKNGRSVGAFLQDSTEVIIAIDVSHEPWRTLGLKLVRQLEEELAEMGLAMEFLDQLIDIIDSQSDQIQ